MANRVCREVFLMPDGQPAPLVCLWRDDRRHLWVRRYRYRWCFNCGIGERSNH